MPLSHKVTVKTSVYEFYDTEESTVKILEQQYAELQAKYDALAHRYGVLTTYMLFNHAKEFAEVKSTLSI